jgi:hypothetical protein
MNASAAWRGAKLAGFLTLLLAPMLSAQDAVRLEEAFVPGYRYHVSQRVDLSGTLTAPPEKGQTSPKPISIRGDSAIEYDERVLEVAPGNTLVRTIRHYERMNFNRTLGDVVQSATLRPAVRRLVLLREGSKKAPFSPDGPLTWDEIDQVRTDVSSPLLVGLLPDRPVRPGDTWQATLATVQELTDLGQVNEGRLICTFEKVVSNDGKRLARVGLSGTLRGSDQDGAAIHTLKGVFDFDLEAKCLTYLQLNGTQVMLRESREVGRIEGRFVLSRRPGVENPRLSDDALRGLTLVPNDENSRLLYEDPAVGLRLVYPRRWHIAGTRGSNQVALEAAGGALLLLTVEPLVRTPTSAQFLAESREYLQTQKARILQVEPPQALSGTGVERFALETEVDGQKVRMVYYLGRFPTSGLIGVARIPPNDQAALLAEVERMIRAAAVTPRPGEKP